MIQAYIGDGKGKTTAAIGLAVRALGAGMKVCLIFFDKGTQTYAHNEISVLEKIGVTCHVTGVERMNPDGSFRFGIKDEDKTEAVRGIRLAKDCIVSGKFDMVILDEFLSAITYDLLPPNSVSEIIGIVHENFELVLTGRCGDESLLSDVDLVSKIAKIRHYFDKGIRSRAGIEF